MNMALLSNKPFWFAIS